MTLRTHLGLTPEIYKFSCLIAAQICLDFSPSLESFYIQQSRKLESSRHFCEIEVTVRRIFPIPWARIPSGVPVVGQKEKAARTRQKCSPPPSWPQFCIQIHSRIESRSQTDGGGGEPSPWGSPCLMPNTGSRGPTGSHSALDRPRMTRHCRRLRTLQERHRASTLEKKQPPIVEASFSPS